LNFYRTAISAFIFVLVGCLIGSVAQAQTGLALGYSARSIEVLRANHVAPDQPFNFSFGAFTTIRISSNVAFRPGVAFSQISTEYRDLSSHLDGSLAVVRSLEVSGEYLEFPLLFEFQREFGSAFKVVAGPAFGFLTSSEFNQDGWQEEGWATGSEIGAVLGLGYSTGLGKSAVGVDLLFRQPMTKFGNKSTYIGEAKVGGFSIVGHVSL